MAEIMKGNKYRVGIAPWHKGKKCPKLSGKNNGQWRGGKTVDKHGYVLIKKRSHPFCSSTGYVREHRLIIEKIIGRYLKPNEKVHHLEEKDNNNPKKLIAFVNHSAHVRFERNGKVKKSEIIFDGRLL